MKKETIPGKNISANRAFRIMLTGFIIMLFVALFCAVYFSVKMKQVSEADARTYEIYDMHYVFIADNAEKEFWNEVYAAAVEEGEKENVYVERLGENLNVNYQTEDLLRIANNSSVDGIIFCGEDNEETVKLINEAVHKGIAVVSLRQDIEDSERQCFVGVNSYDLGLEYGKQILELAQQEEMLNPRICILADNTMSESKQNLITFAIRDCFSGRETCRRWRSGRSTHRTRSARRRRSATFLWTARICRISWSA